MPARSPAIDRSAAIALRALGAQLRTRRKQLQLSAVVTAEAARLSRVTLHRIERGEPSVAMGSYLAVVDALGLSIELRDRSDRKRHDSTAATLPRTIRIADYPQLKKLAWQLHGKQTLSPSEAMDLYERNWRHVEPNKMRPNERELVRRLQLALDRERLLV